MWTRSLGWEDPLEEGMATHYSILAWRIPWTEEPGGLNSSQGRKESDTTEVTQQACTYKIIKNPGLFQSKPTGNQKAESKSLNS